MPVNVFLNGVFCEKDSARISIEDRGFLFGDGIYEVIRFYDGVYFQLEKHLDRLAKSAQKIYLQLPYSRKEIADICYALLNKSGLKNGKLYIQFTRGSAARTHEFPRGASPTVLMQVSELNENSSLKKKGVNAITYPDERWGRCDIKSVNLLPNVLAKEAARSRGYYEAIFVHPLGITEGASSNVFAVINGKLVTAPEGKRILSGITRDIVLSLAGEAGIPLEFRYLSKDEAYNASELFITSTTEEITPVVSLDDKLIGDGRAGKLTRHMQGLFQKVINSGCY